MSFIPTLSRWAGVLGAVLLAFTGAMLTYEVVARYFFVRPTIWAAELSQLCLIWGCLLAMAWVLDQRHHITVNAVVDLLPPRLQTACVTFSLVAIVVFSVIVTAWGWDIFWDSWQRGRTTGSLLDMPAWVAELSVPVGFALLTLQCVAELLRLPKQHIRSLGVSQE